MSKITYEEAVFEAYREIKDDLLDVLSTSDRDLIQRYFGLFPYQDHSYDSLGRELNIPRSTAHYRVRAILRILKKEAVRIRLKISTEEKVPA